MATKTSFKQQCPSCEFMVPIRDSSLVGRKIDCPKCKFRFEVEAPAGAEEDEAPARPAKGATTAAKPNGKGAKPGLKAGAKADSKQQSDRPAKKEKGGSGMLVGSLLAVLALALLGGGAYMIFKDGGDDKKPSGPTPGGPTPGGPVVGGPAGDNQGDKQDDKKDQPAVSGVDITNLLPNDTQSVVWINNTGGKDGKSFFSSQLSGALFETAGAFSKDSFENRMGFPSSAITQMVVGVHRDWTFSVLRINVSLKREDLVAKLNLTAGAKGNIQGQEYFNVGAELDPLVLAGCRNLSRKPTALHLYDSNTLVLGDVEVVEKFLDSKRQPAFLTQPPPPPGNEGGEAGMGGMGPGGMGGVPPMPGGMGGAPPPPIGAMGGAPPPPIGAMGGAPPPPINPGGMGVPPMPGMGGMGEGAGGEQKPPAPAGTFLTIRPALKKLFDVIDEKKQMVAFAFDPQMAKPVSDYLQNRTELSLKDLDLGVFSKTVREWIKDEVAFEPRDGIVGVQTLSDDRLILTVAFERKTGFEARDLDNKVRTVVAEKILPAVEELLDLKISVAGTQPAAAQFGMAGGNFGMAGMGFIGATGFPPGMGAGGVPPAPIGARGLGNGPPGMAAMGGPPPMPGGVGLRGGPPPMPGGVGGFRGGPPPMPGGIMGGPPMPGVGFMGGDPGNPGNPGGPRPDGESVLDARAFDKMFVLTVNLKLNEHDIDLGGHIRKFLANEAVTLRNATVLAAHRSYLQELAGLLKAYTKEKNQFPRGTANRPPDKQRSLEWAPNQRVSWLAELLAKMEGTAYQSLKVERDKSWNEGDNLTTAVTAIPHFLAPEYPPGSWRSEMPGAPSQVAATHFVGIAGLGLDAAGFEAGDEATKKKLGVFGYDRETKLSDITDGPDKTIAVIQVPPTYRTSWLAGGGSTVRGVIEADGIDPFVCTKYKGEEGTFVIMADSKVRFLKASTPKETFLALCTIAGGEAIDNIDEIAPEVKGNVAVLRPRLPETPKPPVEAPKPPVEEPKPKATTSADLDRRVKSNELKQIGLAYHNYYQMNKKGPARVEDLAPFYENAAPITERLKGGVYVLSYNVDLLRLTQGTSNTVLGYEADAPTKGGLVLMADGSVRNTTAQEFQTLAKAGR